MIDWNTAPPSSITMTTTSSSVGETTNNTSQTASVSSSSSTISDDNLILRGYKGTLPVFLESEIKVDTLLGSGSFCMAWTIKKMELKEDEADDTNDQDRHHRHHHHHRRLPNPEGRRRLAQRVNAATAKRDPSLAIRGRPVNAMADPTAPPRCVVKRLRTDIFAHFDDMSRAAEDLKAELEILLQVGTGEHANIIDLYAIGIASQEREDHLREKNYDNDDDDDDPQEERGISFQPTFLILSRIRSTLEQLLVRWRDQRGLGVYEALSLDKAGTQKLWLERMILLSRLADAIQYLHSKRIIFRDVKPENVGVDDNGVVKLFDFGLARQIKQQDEDRSPQKGLYRLTGSTGTPRYMAPEVHDGYPYGYTVDVYSHAIVMHQVLSLKTPFAQVPSSEFEFAVYGMKVRPPLDKSWPVRLQETMEKMWHADPRERPTSENVASTLSEMLRGSDAELFPKRGWFG